MLISIRVFPSPETKRAAKAAAALAGQSLSDWVTQAILARLGDPVVPSPPVAQPQPQPPHELPQLAVNATVFGDDTGAILDSI